ncbi:protein MIX23-like [Saccostrea echinata]|uniref:protein MIX23-like n=1 Tax=Saccostrea echinata TaxID=191078 RepID=UPI002A7F7079|nr:protein MIX23-like [Saccostrea echinata]
MAASSAKHENDLPCDLCDDFLAFQEQLKKHRLVDDRIINTLNSSLPTISFPADRTTKCESLYKELSKEYEKRETAIKSCVALLSKKVEILRKERENNMDDYELTKNLRKEQTKLRLMQQELCVEEVVKDTSLKAFQERCRQYYKPPISPPV